MKTNRRTVLFGLGTIAVGGGAAFGSGAFTQVDASRQVQVSVAADSSALLGLVAGTSEFVSEDAGVLTIDISNLNLDGTTTFEQAFSIVNNSDSAGGGQGITVSADITGAGDSGLTNLEQIVQFNADAFGGTDILGTGNDVTLAEPGEGTSETDVTVVIDLSGVDDADTGGDVLLEEVTFTATGQH